MRHAAGRPAQEGAQQRPVPLTPRTTDADVAARLREAPGPPLDDFQMQAQWPSESKLLFIQNIFSY